jgi:RNase P/RNase MRP subunit p29
VPSSFAIQLRRGTTSQHSTFTGLEGEVTVDTTKDTLVIHDGVTAGGYPLAKEQENLNPFLLMGA